jgi:HK97 family phage major capsid protein
MPLDDTGAAAELKKTADDLKKATEDVMRFAEKAQTEIKNLGTMTAETKAASDKALTTMNELASRVGDVEQKLARPRGPAGEPMKTLGQMVVENEDVKALLASKNGQARVKAEYKDILSGTALWGTGISPTTSLTIPDRQDIVRPPLRPLVVRDLLMPGSTTSNAIEYPVETDNPLTITAAMVSEGAVKPQQPPLVFDLKSSPVRTLAHYQRASRQILDDATQLMSYIDGRLRYGLAFVEEQQFLFGDGTGLNLFGIIPQATAYSAAFTPTSPQNIDILRLAALQSTLALYPASGYVLHPTDWAKIELTKDGYQRYLVGDPQSQLEKTLWGLPVVQSMSMVAGHFLTGAFKLGAQIFDRLTMEVLISTENADDFVRNMITIRAEERLAFAVYRPAAFIYGVLT